MTFIKIAKSSFKLESQGTERIVTASEIEDSDFDIHERLKTFAQSLKSNSVVAPRAKDFLYFTCVMMHAAEAVLYDGNGNIKNGVTGKPLEAAWEKTANGGLKWICNDPSVMPLKNSNCFIAGTEILMSDGSVKNIEDVEVGDEVFTHKGRVKKVTNTFVNKYEGELLDLGIRNNRHLITTPEHPFYKLDIEGDADTPRHLLRNKSSKKEFIFTEAKDLKRLEMLTSPIINKNVKCDISEQEAWVLGVFAAEGSYGKKYGNRQEIIFSFNINEADTLAKKTVGTLLECFPGISVRLTEKPDRSVCEVKATGKKDGVKLSDYFYSKVGEYSSKKTLSEDLVFGPNDIKKQFIIGWLEGDGHVEKNFGKIIGVTTSTNLANQVRLMLHSLKIGHSLYLNKSGGMRVINKDYPPVMCKDHYRIEISAPSGENLIKNSSFLNFTKIGNRKVSSPYYEDYFIGNIVTSIEELDFSGYVYNFEVEDDHSYIANNIAVHNCDIFPESELKLAYKKWVGKPLCLDHKSSSVDFVRGVIIDTVYDEKRKRVIALCALDKKNYPDLADKVTSGVANDVSMGTAVGRAVCTENGCHTVARVAADFCEHMQNKSAYGEINLDLAPIELSLVVSGADPDAKVKHIVANDLKSAAQSLEDYLEGKLALGSISNSELVGIQIELQELTEKVRELADKTSEDQNDTNYGTTASQKGMSETIVDSVNQNIQSGTESWPSYASELQREILGTQVKLASLQESVNKISFKDRNEENNMSEIDKNAYMQGTVEPNAGGQTYTPEPGNIQGRMADKHMHGAPPFPGVGPVDGSYPGVGENDEALKRKLQRAASDDERNRLMRQAILARHKDQLKNAYMQGTEDPTKYPVDPTEGKARKEDKQMVGKKPFPGVGKIDGLYGDDMKTKEMLARASINAKFRKVISPSGLLDKNASRWDVYANGKLIVSTTVGQITRNNADALYDSIATKGFGKNLISEIRSDYKATLSKFAAPPVMAAPEAVAAPEPEAAPAPAAAMPDADLEMDIDAEGAGEPEGQTAALVSELDQLQNDMGDVITDLREATEGVDADADALEGVEEADEAEIEAVEAAPQPVEATTASLQSMRKTVNGMLRSGLRESFAELSAHTKEIGYVRDLYSGKYASMSGNQKQYLNTLAAEAVTEARSTLGEGVKMIAAFVDYAQGTVGVIKKAQEIGMETPIPFPEDMLPEGDDLLGEEEAIELDDDFALDMDDDISYADDCCKECDKPKKDCKCEDDCDSADDNAAAMIELTEGALGEDALDGATVHLASNATKEELAMSRVKLAQKGLQFSNMLNQAHPGGSEEVSNLDNKPSDPMAKFHVLEDTHSKMMDLANAPPKVRKQASEIAKSVEAGHIRFEDVDQLVSHGVDSEAVKYYKQYWAEARDTQSSDFAGKLTQEHVKQKQAEDMKSYQVRVKRAYELANKMVRVGHCDESRVDEQVQEIMTWNDAGFNSMVKQMSRQPAIKQASIPSVGLLSSAEVILPSVENSEVGGANSDVKGFFESYFQNKKF